MSALQDGSTSHVCVVATAGGGAAARGALGSSLLPLTLRAGMVLTGLCVSARARLGTCIREHL